MKKLQILSLTIILAQLLSYLFPFSKGIVSIDDTYDYSPTYAIYLGFPIFFSIASVFFVSVIYLPRLWGLIPLLLGTFVISQAITYLLYKVIIRDMNGEHYAFTWVFYMFMLTVITLNILSIRGFVLKNKKTSTVITF